MAENLITLITGANQGIGYYAAGHFAKAGKYKVLLGCRDVNKAAKAIEQLVAEEGAVEDAFDVVQLDVTSDESIEKAAKSIEEEYGRLDILVNNAGVAFTQGSLREQHIAVFNVNVHGPAVTTEAFLPLLRKSTLPGGKKIIFVSSGMGSIGYSADPEFPYGVKKLGPNGRATIYRASKSALNMLIVDYAVTLEDEGFVVGGVCPGYCATNLNENSGPKHPRDGAKVVLYAVEKPKEFVHAHVTNEDTQYPW